MWRPAWACGSRAFAHGRRCIRTTTVTSCHARRHARRSPRTRDRSDVALDPEPTQTSSAGPLLLRLRSCCFEDVPLRRAREAGFFWAGEIIFERHVPNWRIRLPRAALVDGNLAALAVFRCGGDVAHGMATNSFRVVALPAVLHDGKAARFQLIDIPKVAAA